MSAFICQPEHFGILAALAIFPDQQGHTAALPEWVVPGDPILTAQRVARDFSDRSHPQFFPARQFKQSNGVEGKKRPPHAVTQTPRGRAQKAGA